MHFRAKIIILTACIQISNFGRQKSRISASVSLTAFGFDLSVEVCKRRTSTFELVLAGASPKKCKVCFFYHPFPKSPSPPNPSLHHPSQNPKTLLSSITPKPSLLSNLHLPNQILISTRSITNNKKKRNDFRVWADEDDVESRDLDDYDMDEDEAEELYSRDYDIEYDRLLLPSAEASAASNTSDDIEMVQSESFVSTQGWESDKVVDYRINEEEFHKISLLNCDFFIRKPPDPNNDVYDFREMYVTPLDTDVYSIPKVLAADAGKESDYGRHIVTEPPIDAPRDPLYKHTKEILKVFLMKHYRNRRINDPEFFLDYEEIYVIDSMTKSITKAKVLVTVPEGRNRNRLKDMLIVCDNGTSFKIIPMSERLDPDTIIETEEWIQSRREMEKHLRKLRDFPESNWF